MVVGPAGRPAIAASVRSRRLLGRRCFSPSKPPRRQRHPAFVAASKRGRTGSVDAPAPISRPFVSSNPTFDRRAKR